MKSSATMDPTVQDLRRRSEETRANLAMTIETLTEKVTETADLWKDRVNPDNVKAEVKDYVQKKGESIIESVKRKAIDNPIQALAIGAGLTLPLLNVARALPVPLMLIGAGLLLSRPSAREAVDRVQNAASEKLEEIREGAGDVIAGATDKVREASETVVRTGTEWTEAAKQIVKMSPADSKPGAQDPGTTQRATETLAERVENHPMLIAGIGLAIGAAVAAALPSTVVEAEIASGAGEKIKDVIGEMSSNAIEAVHDAKTRVTDELAERGVTVEAISEQGEALRTKAETVARAGLDAFSEDRSNAATSQQS